MKKIITLMILFQIGINSSYSQVAVKLDMDEPAPFAGVLLKESKVKDLYKKELKVIKLKDLADTNNRRAEYYKEESIMRKKQLESERTYSTFKSIGYFILGAILTGAATKVALESAR